MGYEVWELLNIGGYRISDTDSLGTVRYYGFLQVDSKWYIMKEDTTNPVVTYRYIKGDSGYAAAWAGRAALSYDTYDVIFR